MLSHVRPQCGDRIELALNNYHTVCRYRKCTKAEANNNGNYINSVAKNQVIRTTFIYDPKEKNKSNVIKILLHKGGFREALSDNHLPKNGTYAMQKTQTPSSKTIRYEP